MSEECKKCSQGLMGDWCDACLREEERKCRQMWEDYNCGCLSWFNNQNCYVCNEIYQGMKKKKKKFLALWYSVSPPRDENYTVEKGLLFIKRVKKFIQANSILKAIYAFEWKYKDNNPDKFYGIHCHMLLFGDRGKINQHIARQAEKYWNLNPEQRYIIYEEALIKEKIDYFTGNTWDKSKNTEKHYDCSTRKLHSLSEEPQFKNCDFGTFGVSSSNNPESSPSLVNNDKLIVEF